MGNSERAKMAVGDEPPSYDADGSIDPAPLTDLEQWESEQDQIREEIQTQLKFDPEGTARRVSYERSNARARKERARVEEAANARENVLAEERARAASIDDEEESWEKEAPARSEQDYQRARSFEGEYNTVPEEANTAASQQQPVIDIAAARSRSPRRLQSSYKSYT